MSAYRTGEVGTSSVDCTNVCFLAVILYYNYIRGYR